MPMLEPEDEEMPVYRLEDDDKYFEITPEGKGWRIKGKRVQDLALQTMFELPESAARFQRALRALGILDALKEKGIKEGEMVYIGPVELEWWW
jgi:GTPase